jgi:hypothetical protein
VIETLIADLMKSRSEVCSLSEEKYKALKEIKMKDEEIAKLNTYIIYHLFYLNSRSNNYDKYALSCGAVTKPFRWATCADMDYIAFFKKKRLNIYDKCVLSFGSET